MDSKKRIIKLIKKYIERALLPTTILTTTRQQLNLTPTFQGVEKQATKKINVRYLKVLVTPTVLEWYFLLLVF